MSHAYPLGHTACEALRQATAAARTRYEAEDLADGAAVMALETEWLTPTDEELDDIDAALAANPGHGFIQTYEDAKGKPVLAVTYWKVSKAKAKPKPKPVQVQPVEIDDTDDLYFKTGRTKKSRRKRFIDPNQLDLFGKPESGD